MIDNKVQEYRDLFMAIAVLEHHQLADSVLSPYDLCEILGPIWDQVLQEIKIRPLSFDSNCILNINRRIAEKIGCEPGGFKEAESWHEFVEACGDIEDDPAHVSSWLFSALYWNRLSRLRISTAWIFVNAIRLQHGLSLYQLPVENIGPFMRSLSGSGPPIYDGQTFYPEDYSSKENA